MEEVPLNKSFVFIPENMENIESLLFFVNMTHMGQKVGLPKLRETFAEGANF